MAWFCYICAHKFPILPTISVGHTLINSSQSWFLIMSSTGTSSTFQFHSNSPWYHSLLVLLCISSLSSSFYFPHPHASKYWLLQSFINWIELVLILDHQDLLSLCFTKYFPDYLCFLSSSLLSYPLHHFIHFWTYLIVMSTSHIIYICNHNNGLWY